MIAKLTALFIVLFIGGLLVMLAWNIGIVALVAACGGTVTTISYWTALFVNVAVRLVAGVFRGKPVEA